ncbi:hypothetical protein [Mesorhizobium sp.]|uniref:hypothetical protein n=1 Tax=Mesorhizobium sp. TaxID=1871066 RepID=UPI00257D2265|nr:hypothetical protein [Mesorhizobium sp.]
MSQKRENRSAASAAAKTRVRPRYTIVATSDLRISLIVGSDFTRSWAAEGRADTDEVTKVHLDIRFKRIRVLPPIGKKKRYPALDLTVIHAVEPNPPTGRKRIGWKLLTDLEVNNCEEGSLSGSGRPHKAGVIEDLEA